MSGWDDTPAADDGAWKADEPAGNGFQADGDDFNGKFSAENISKHANGDAGGPSDGGCRVCGSDSHFARDCPDKQENSGECYNCGELGHSKAECTNPRVEREFTGQCRICDQSGHRAADCPDKPPTTCNLCKIEGHMASECSVNRMFTNFAGMEIKELSAEEGWKNLEEADKEKDVDDIKTAIITYAKAYPDVTFEELESVFREAGMNTHLIAKQQEVADTHTIVNLQGRIDQEYVVSIQFSSKPRRVKFAEGWPETPEENMLRLAKCGFPMDRMVPKCANCGQLGHGSKTCPEEKTEREKLAITCANCNEEGHRARDCAQPRKSNKRGCRNCGQEDHIAKECPEPPNLDNVECKGCGNMGHFSRDCPDREPDICHNCQQEGHRAKDCTNERVVKCRNCDELGHVSKECPKPTDWSRVECNNCHEKGHSYKRCPHPPAEPAEAEGGESGGWGGGNGAATAGGDDANGGGDAWGEPVAACTGGGW